MSKRLIGIIVGCKDKASSWYLNGFLDGSNIESIVSCRGEGFLPKRFELSPLFVRCSEGFRCVYIKLHAI